jgi:hypothetical protein
MARRAPKRPPPKLPSLTVAVVTTVPKDKKKGKPPTKKEK